MIVFIAYYELGLLVNRHTGSLIKQYCFDGAKVLLFHDVHKYPKLAFFSSTYCGNPLHTCAKHDTKTKGDTR